MSKSPFEEFMDNVMAEDGILRGVGRALLARNVSLENKTAYDYPELIETMGTDQPTLNAVSISRSNDTISISNPSSNGNFVNKYRVYDGDDIIKEVTGSSFSLTGLGAGTYELTIAAVGEYFIDSVKSNKIKASVFSIARTLENLSANNSTALISNGLSYTVTLTPASGYYLPEDIVVTMGGNPCNFEYNSYTGVVTIASVTGNVVITAAALSTPKVRRPVVTLSGHTLNVAPTQYAQTTEIYIDNVLTYTLNGTTATDYDLSQQVTAYGMYAIKVVSKASGYDDSDDVITSYNIGATISIQGNIITVVNVISGITSFGVYVDNTLVGTVLNNGTTLDMSAYSESVDDGKHSVTLNAIGTGVAANRSNPVTWFCGTAPIYGVSGLFDSTPALTRTDDAVGLSFLINSSSGAVDSDFDEVFPWSEAEIVEDTAGKFIKMPEMYFRIGVDGESRITDVAVSAMPSGAGTWFKVDPFMYGCYGAGYQSSKLVSVSGVSRKNNTTRANFRTYAANNGAGYFQLDLYHRNVMMFLWMIEFATKNSQSIMKGRVGGSGTQGGYSARPTGGTDNLTTPSGFETDYGQMRWHYIEDFVGNMFEFVDGICAGNWSAAYYVTDDPTKFADTSTNMSATSYNAPNSNDGYCIAAFGWDSDHPFLCMPCKTVNNSSFNTYFCDQVYLNGSSYPVLFVGDSYYNGDSYYGLAQCHTTNTSSYSDYYGARLLKTA